MKTQKVIHLKTGECLIKGRTVQFIPNNTTACKVLNGGETFHVRITSAFNVPNIKILEKWVMDGVAKSVTGKRVEPDGFGPDGSPSWLLVLGMI